MPFIYLEKSLNNLKRNNMNKETLEEAAENLFNDFQKENQIIPKNDIRP